MFDSLFDTFLRLDGPVFAWVEANLHPGGGGFLDAFFKAVTHLGDGGVFWIVLAVALLLFKRTRKAGIVMAAALILDSILVNAVLKNIFERPRPYDFLWDGTGFTYVYHEMIKKPSEFSFPSGHTGVSFAGSLGMLLGAYAAKLDKRMKILAWCTLTLAALIGFSRVYLGVHYATDILGGVLVGLACALLALLILRAIEPLVDRLESKSKRKKA